MQAVNRKNKFAYFENCSGGQRTLETKLAERKRGHAPSKNFGKNVAALYLLVVM